MKFKSSTHVQKEVAKNPGAVFKAVANKAKQSVQKLDSQARLIYAATLKQQGKLFGIIEEGAAEAWSKAVQLLPSALLKFGLNASQDTLPHNANLACWHPHLQDSCKLCGARQTLHHILNSCPVALHSRHLSCLSSTHLSRMQWVMTTLWWQT